MSEKAKFGGEKGAIRVVAGQTYTATSGYQIYEVVPDPSFTGKANAINAKFASMTGDRLIGGADVSGKLQRFNGRYASVVCAAGACDVYEETATHIIND